jgi:hypothetical protein
MVTYVTAPVGEEVQHCNRYTEWDVITHVYQPDTCDHCQRIARFTRPLRVKLWTYCYQCHRLFGAKAPLARQMHQLDRATQFVSHNAHKPMWLWDYALLFNGRRLYSRAQFRTFDAALTSAQRQYPRLRDVLESGIVPPPIEVSECRERPA